MTGKRGGSMNLDWYFLGNKKRIKNICLPMVAIVGVNAINIFGIEFKACSHEGKPTWC